MLSKAWNWTKQNKGKVIVGGLIVGGLAYVGRKLYLKAKELNDLINNQIPSAELLQQLSLGQSQEWKMNLHFQRNQKVADVTVKKTLQRAKAALFKLYEIDEITNILRDQSTTLTPEQKGQHFNRIKVQCISRAVAASYVVHILLLLHRIEINLIGRQMFTDQQADSASKRHEENYAFLSSTRYIQEEGLIHLVEAVTAAVEAATETIPAQENVTLEGVGALLKDICQRVDMALINEGRAVRTILPEDVAIDGQSLTAEGRAHVSQCLSETRDLLDSPQFAAVFRLCIEGANKRLVELLGERFPPGQPFPLAKTFGRLCQLAEAVMASTFTNTFIEDFNAVPAVGELCELVYFPPDYNRQRIPKTPSLNQLIDRLNFHV
eukprot:GDKI01037133.1.p1 GENE.GDKI01037133.1~~GDKI01037133.1.p1  ORF type:complete len:379 (+),score=80.64 GDKI01037133.1:47-1183(+)